MSRLFDRLVAVDLGTANAQGRRYTDLRVGFSVTMTEDATPNNCKIELYNPVRTATAAMQRDDAVIQLSVGYRSQGALPRLIFKGNPIPGGVKRVRRGVDHVLEIQAQDGGREYTSSHVAETFSSGTTSGSLFAFLADKLGLPLGNVDGVVGDVSFQSGVTLQGRVAEVLDRIADMSDARWQIRDGTLQVWPVAGSTGEQAVVFSAATGNLVGSPSPTDEGVEVTALIAPSLRPGKPFRIESDQITGNYVATSVEFKGDSGYGPDFYVIARGRPV